MSGKGGFVYILASGRNGTLYIGVTSDLARRVWEHRNGATGGFATRYKVHRLVWYAHFDDIETAIAREKAMKKWRLAWKLREIEAMNADWRDLYDDLNS